MHNPTVRNQSLLDANDIIRFREGTHYELYQKMGSHPGTIDGVAGRYFAVWAPAALAVSVIGEFNNWQHAAHPLFRRNDQSGIWQGFVEGCRDGQLYKYHIKSASGIEFDKGDPFANYWEFRPKTASVLASLEYQWLDGEWMDSQRQRNGLDTPWIVYEVHFSSWMRPVKDDENAFISYRQAIELLVPYVKESGFTHVELMPVMEHPNDASWGYQGTGYFAPSSRFGSPVEFMQLIDAFHQAGIGVILDWVPSHFPYDAHGLYMFDGTHCYEYSDMRKGYHPDWHSYIFNYGKGEVKSFLTSSAHFWLDLFHADALRVDGVSSVLILSYSRRPEQWEPNIEGGDQNLEAMKFLQDLNESIKDKFAAVQVIAEESTAWPMVTGPVKESGLGFGMKWMMGWMHDTLEYFKLSEDQRQEHRDRFRLSMHYFYHERFMLALSHDEVVYGKKPLLLKMPGNEEQQFANLRLLYTYMFTHPGPKLLFMGDEFGSTLEWNYKSELPWELLKLERHRALQRCVMDLCRLLHAEPALYENQFERFGFEWVETEPAAGNIFAYRRRGKFYENDLLITLNMGNSDQENIKVAVAANERWQAIFNSNSKIYGGEIQENTETPTQNNDHLHIDMPGLSALILKQTFT